MSNQNDIENLKDKVDRGLISAAQANVQIVRNERVKIVTRLSKNVRTTLNKAVKIGDLAHMRKQERKPEIYYHPGFKDLAIEVRNQQEQKAINALMSVCS